MKFFKQSIVLTILLMLINYGAHAEYTHCDNYLKQLVVLIGGTSSAGKTSTINELKKIRPDIVVDGIDLISLRTYPQFIKAFFPDEYAALVKVFNEDSITGSITETIPDFLPHSTHEERRNALRAIEIISQAAQAMVERFGGEDKADKAISDFYNELLANQTVEYLSENQFVVLDVMDVQAMEESLKAKEVSADIKSVLLSVPFDDFLQRVNSRNEKAIANNEPMELREPLDIMSQYAVLYQVVPVRQGNSIQPLALPEARTILLQALEASKHLYKMMGEEEDLQILIQDGEVIVEKILINLGFSDDLTEGYLTPKMQYDLELESYNGDPKQRAVQIDKLFL